MESVHCSDLRFYILRLVQNQPEATDQFQTNRKTENTI